MTNTVTLFRNFRLSALLDSKRNYLVQNFTDYFRETQLVRSNRKLDPTVLGPYEFLRRYGDQTPGNSPFITDKGNKATVSDVIDAYLQPGDFMRLRELSVTYTVPSQYLGLFHNSVTGASVSLALQNVKLWTNYQGADPEVVSNPAGVNGAFSRQDFLTLPNPKSTVLRFNLTF